MERLPKVRRSHAAWNLLANTCLWFIAATADAAPVTISNPGFENISGEPIYNEFSFGPPPGWELYDPFNITNDGDGPTYYVGTLTPFEPNPVTNPGVYANFPDGAAEGQRVAIAFNYSGSGGQGEYGLRQTLAETLQPNTRYELQVEIGNIASATSRDGTPFDLDGFPGYRVDLLAGGVAIAQDNNSLEGLIAEGEFGTSTVSFTTGFVHPRFGQALGIRLVNLNEVDSDHPGSDLEVDFDHVRLDASPASEGDFNFDGVTDAADYVVWQSFSGIETMHEVWQANFGSSSGGGAAARLATVPEPHGMMWMLLAALLSVTSRRPLARSFANERAVRFHRIKVLADR